MVWTTINDAANQLGISRRTLERRIKSGDIQAALDRGRRSVFIEEPATEATALPAQIDTVHSDIRDVILRVDRDLAEVHQAARSRGRSLALVSLLAIGLGVFGTWAAYQSGSSETALEGAEAALGESRHRVAELRESAAAAQVEHQEERELRQAVELRALRAETLLEVSEAELEELRQEADRIELLKWLSRSSEGPAPD